MFKSISKEKKEIIVGTTAIILLFLSLFVFYNQNSSSSFLSKGNSYHVFARFNKADGIMSGDLVRLAGLPIGKIEAINLNENFGVEVKISVSGDVKLPEDSSASIHTSGFFGKKYIEITPGGMYENIPDGGFILYTQDSMLVEDLLDRIISIGKSLRGITDSNENQEGEKNES